MPQHTAALTASALALGLTASPAALADDLDAGASYAYTTGPMPGFSGGTFYVDEGHDGYGTAGAYDVGDLNDGVLQTSGDPVGTHPNTIVAWDPVDTTPIPVTITFDLGAIYNVDEVVLHSYLFTAYSLGGPDDFDLSFSDDNTTYTAATTVSTGFTHVTGGQSVSEDTTGTQARYVRIALDGDATGGDKYSLTEIEINGTPVPEPASAALAAIGGLLVLGRRRR